MPQSAQPDGFDPIRQDLNPVQHDAVIHTGGPLLVVAGAGSGKTRVLTHRIAHLIDEGMSPFEILAITFTNKAAKEMKTRVGALVGPVAERMWVSTFHSACVRMLRRDAERLGYPSGFSIYDQADAVRLTGYVVRDLGLDAKRFHPRGVHAAISAAKNAGTDAESFAETAGFGRPRQIADVFAEYQRRLRAAGAMDFDDLLTNTSALLREHPEARQHWQRRFAHVLVDEYQDTNSVQNDLVMALAAEHRQVTVVGDSDQSVYAFRGADVANILEFEKAFPDASTLVLDQNYRSTQTILDAANDVIVVNTGRKPKDLWSDLGTGRPIVYYHADDADDEAQWVADSLYRLNAHDGVDYADMAVFYRVHSQSRALEESLVRVGIPYRVVAGTRFYDRREVKDAIAYVRAMVNPADEVSVKRVINTPRRGLGAVSIQRLDDWAAANDAGFHQALLHHAEAGLSAKAAAGVREFLALTTGAVGPAGGEAAGQQGLGEAGSIGAGGIADEGGASFAAVVAQRDPAELIREVLTESGYLHELQDERTTEAETRLENLEEVVNIASEHDTVEEFLERVSLVNETDNLGDPDSDPSAVVLMTLHAAKGLEFDTVFITGMEDGVLPHFRALTEPDELEEERRLAYVGMTRAMRRLHLSSAWSRMMNGFTQHNPPSRFLDDIRPELIEHSSASRFGAGRAGGRGSYGRGGSAGRGAAHGGRGAAYLSSAGGLSTARGSVTGWRRSSGNGERGPGGAGDRSRIDSSRDHLVEQALRAAAKPAPDKAAVPALAVGDDVRHDIFGEGVVLDLSGEGDKAEAVVHFAAAGEKRLLLSWANLAKLG